MKFLFVILLIGINISCSTSKKEAATTDTTSNQDSNDSTTAIYSTSAQPQSVQTEDSSTFGKFKKLFDSPGSEIPEDVLTALSITTEVGRYTSREVLENEAIVFVLFNHMKQVGPGIDELFAATFLKDGTLLEVQLLGSSYPSSGPDGGGQDYDYQYDSKRKVISVTNSTTDWDEAAQEEVTKKELQYLQLTRDGKLIRVDLINIRQYPEVSERLVEKSELLDKTKEELMIMRNEPFAAYGYIFKNKFLKNYFESREWYDPQFENVNERLSEIEKKNIQLIKQVEDIK